MLIDQARDNRVDRYGLAGAGRASDQQVRHLRQVRDHRLAFEIAAQRKREGSPPCLPLGGLDQFAQGHHPRRRVRHLDPHGALAGNRRHADRGRAHAHREVIGQGHDPARLNSGPGDDLELGNHGARRPTGDSPFDLEGAERIQQRLA
jgi:hypothetical protein